MRFESDTKLDFQDVLLKPKRSEIKSRGDIDLTRWFKFKHTTIPWIGVPIVSSNMSSVTNRSVACVMEKYNMLACAPKNALGEYIGTSVKHLIASIGIKLEGTISEFDQPHMICLDAPNGYIEPFVNALQKLRSMFTNKIIIAGNVVSPEMTETLLLAGADVVKVGIGSGSACATRLKTGVGYPQLSAVIECADAAHGLGGHIMSDGGCVTPGDVVKAFAAGADFVMLGGMLAGHDENGQDFYGMSSKRANEEFAGGLKEYRASEGWEIKLPNRGKIEDTLHDILGGLRSACAYVGAKRLKDLPKCATFVRVNHQLNQSLWEYKQ